MNKKGQIEELIFTIILIGFLFFIGMFIRCMWTEYHDYKEYKSFCISRPNFCYCSLLDGGCEFKTSSSYTCYNGNCSEEIFSKETIDLCELATKLNDSEIIFRVGCG